MSLRFLDRFWIKVSQLHPRSFFLETWQEINEEAERLRAEEKKSGSSYNHRLTPLFIYCIVGVVLALQEYFGDRATFRTLVAFITDKGNERVYPFWYSLLSWLEPVVRDIYPNGEYMRLWELGWWAFARIFGYVVIPVLFIPLIPGVRLRECGLSFRGFLDHLWIYLFLFFIVLPAVLIVSYRPDFSNYYPFYKDTHYPHGWTDFMIWELLYFVQFVSLEFFFRGFMLHPLKKHLGAYSIFAMTVPYCMIHFGKPFLETIAAIIAGIVLGTLSLKTRSIWCGALIHITVAFSMDMAALWQTGHWPGWK